MTDSLMTNGFGLSHDGLQPAVLMVQSEGLIPSRVTLDPEGFQMCRPVGASTGVYGVSTSPKYLDQDVVLLRSSRVFTH